MRALSFILFLGISLSAFAQEKLLLITSIDRPEERRLMFKKRKDLYGGLRMIFEESFQGSPYELEVIHEAKAYTLFSKIRSGQYRGIFWVSHANKGVSYSGMASKNLILNKDWVNVAQIFHHLNSKTSFLGLIGCYSESFVSELVASNPSFKDKVIGFDEKVDILNGLRRSIKIFREKDSTLPSQRMIVQKLPGVTIRINRVAGSRPAPELFIYNRGKLIGMIPALDAFGTHSSVFSISEPKVLNDLKIVVSTESYSNKDSADDFGDLMINLAQNSGGDFKMLLAGNRPLGTITRIFRYSGELP